ncbi:MAG TPA: ChbG/HpnK family deacetylase [Candidatus Acidoferrales bacterium]|nr:ChbG/HpnK family deacetylase [Candidatus Acidoferrales bacterium]
MKLERVIINADDLGLSETVNDAIFDLMAQGRVTSATMMANGPAFRHAASMIHHFPRCSFGAHLNLTEFAPLTPGADVAILTGGDGVMLRGLGSEGFGPKLLSAAYRELCAQIELLGAAGIEISHLDSHHHVHTKPQLLPVIKTLQRRFQIRKVRISKNIYTREQPVSPVLAIKKRAYNWALRNCYATRTTDGFAELLSYRTISGRDARFHGSVELMVHPGAAYAAAEVAVLKSDWLAESGLDTRLISYREL